jgi:hypothetical protein
VGTGKQFRNYKVIKISKPEQHKNINLQGHLNPLTPELNPSAQRCLTRLFTGDFAS